MCNHLFISASVGVVCSEHAVYVCVCVEVVQLCSQYLLSPSHLSRRLLLVATTTWCTDTLGRLQDSV